MPEITEEIVNDELHVTQLLKMSDELIEQSKSIVLSDSQLEAMTSKMTTIINMQSLFIKSYSEHIVYLHSNVLNLENQLKALQTSAPEKKTRPTKKAV